MTDVPTSMPVVAGYNGPVARGHFAYDCSGKSPIPRLHSGSTRVQKILGNQQPQQEAEQASSASG